MRLDASGGKAAFPTICSICGARFVFSEMRDFVLEGICQ